MSRCSVKTMNFSSHEARIGEDVSQPVELRLGARSLVDRFGEVAEASRTCSRSASRSASDAATTPWRRRSSESFVLFLAVLGRLLVGGLACPDVSSSSPSRCWRSSSCSTVIRPSCTSAIRPVELLDPALERPQQRVGGTGQTALEDAHGQAGRRAVQQLGPVVDEAQVVGRLVVERLLADVALGQVVAQRVGDPLRIERRAVEADHLLLGPADEVPLPRVGRVVVERLGRREHLRLQQPPQGVVRVVLAHVRRGREQQQVVRRSRAAATGRRRPARRRAPRPAGSGRSCGRAGRARGRPTACGPRRRSPGRRARRRAPEGGRTCAAVASVSTLTMSRVAVRRPMNGLPCVASAAAHDPERQAEQRRELALPVARPGRRAGRSGPGGAAGGTASRGCRGRP